MARSLDPADLVALPRLDAQGMHALATKLLTAAAQVPQKHFPALLKKPLAALDGATKTLAAATRERLAAVAPDTRAADADEDAAWTSLRSWLQGWSSIPGGAPEKATAAALLDALFPDGARFTRLSHEREWSEVEARLEKIKKEKLDVRIESLGGKPFLTAIRAAHEAYGRALGITSAIAQPEKRIKEPLAALDTAVRVYVAKTMAHADPDEPATEKLVSELLLPYAEAQGDPARSSKSTAATQAPPGTAPVASVKTT